MAFISGTYIFLQTRNIYWICGVPILTVQGRVFIGIVNAIMLRS